MQPIAREGGRKTADLPTSRVPCRPKNPPSRPHAPHGPGRRNWRAYRHFLRNGRRRTFERLGELVDGGAPPYTVRPPHTRGRPPTDPRDLARCLLLRSLEGWSFDTTHATLAALPELAHLLGFRSKIPAPSTVAQLVAKVPLTYLENLVQQLARAVVGAHPAHLAGDSTGLGLHRFERWMDLKHAHSSVRHRFLKLHALVRTRARWPLFVAAHVTEANVNDAPAFPVLLDQVSAQIRVGNVTLDKGYQSRAIAQRIADRGGRPVIALQDRVTPLALGHPAWRRMVHEAREDRRRYRGRYRRRSVIEGTFGAFKFRLGSTLRSRRPHAQAVEALARVVVWDVLACVYDGR